MAVQTGTLNRADRAFLAHFPADEETAPWMAITDLHRQAVTAVVQPLTWLARSSRPDWYVASELAVYYRNDDGSSNFIVPDLFIARVPRRLRTSYHIDAEGSPPVFVLEVVSTESRERDTGATDGKVRLYGLLRIEEYAIFDPEGGVSPALQGHRRGPGGVWERWPTRPDGALVSATLGLTLVVDGTLLRLVDAAGRRLPTADEEHDRAEWEQARAERERERAERERAERERERTRAETAEVELARMRALLAQHGLAPDP